MRTLTASDLLAIWEKGAGRGPVEQALILLAKAFPQVSLESLADLTIAQRDASLFLLFRMTFGTQLKALATCPACGERLELSLDWQNLYSLGKFPLDADQSDPHNPEATLRLNDCEVIYRLPTSADLMNLQASYNTTMARRYILESCIIQAHRDGTKISSEKLPDSILMAVEEHMAQAGPIANITLATSCPACRHQWEIIFDIVSFLWEETQFWARRLMQEVHTLASAYGWHEADILAMNAWRRQRYLELLGI
ncbi:MAG: hypothetical protein JEZ00_05345 [Anaerolineaceae bacterium]|nr:hypothetical protein [Anaerolineaceae bacterium]